MKLYKLLFFIPVLMVSCIDSTTDDSTVIADSLSFDTLFNAVPQSKFTGTYDTLGYIFLVNTISKEVYESLESSDMKNEDSLRASICGDKEGGCMEAMEKYYINDFTDKVERKGDQLLLSLTNGKTVTLKNVNAEDDAYEVYQFLTLDRKGYYVVAAFYYESFGYLLINSSNGKITRTIGYPVLSPGGNRYAAGNYDMVAAFTFNGIDFLSAGSDSVASYALMDFINWGPEEVKWKDDSTLYIRQKSQTGEELKEEHNYAALRIREKSGF